MIYETSKINSSSDRYSGADKAFEKSGEKLGEAVLERGGKLLGDFRSK